MTTNRFCRATVLGLSATAALATGAAASVVKEADVGGFSSAVYAPTEIGSSVTEISGTTAQNVYDIFRIALPSETGQIVLSFASGGRLNDSYSAGSTVKYAYEPFLWGWAGQLAGTVEIKADDPSDKVVAIDFDPAFGDTLFLALYNTHGEMDYTITGLGTPGTAPAPIPLPAGIVLLGTALGGTGIAAALRRRKAARD